MKKIFTFLICFAILLSACSNSKDYKRDTSTGKKEEISLAEYKKFVKEDKTFIVAVTQTSCSHCKKYNKMLDKYLKKHHVIMYEVNVTKEKVPADAFDYFEKKYEDFAGTPFTIIYENGEAKEFVSGEINSGDYDDLITEYQLDKKKD